MLLIPNKNFVYFRPINAKACLPVVGFHRQRSGITHCCAHLEVNSMGKSETFPRCLRSRSIATINSVAFQRPRDTLFTSSFSWNPTHPYLLLLMDASEPISLPGRCFSIWIRRGDAIIPNGNPYATAAASSASEAPASSTTAAHPADAFSLWTSGAPLACNTISSSAGGKAAAAPSISLPGNSFTLWTKAGTKAPTPSAVAAAATAAPQTATSSGQQPQEGQSSLLPAVLVSIVLIPLLLILGAFTYQQINELNAEKDKRKEALVENNRMTEEITGLNKATNESKAAADKAMKELASAQSGISTLEKKLQIAEKEALTKNSEVQKLTQTNTQQKDALAKATSAGEKARSDLMTRIGALEKERDTAAVALEKLTNESKAAATALEARATAAEESAKKLAEEKAAIEGELNKAKDAAQVATSLVENLQKQLDEAKAKAAAAPPAEPEATPEPEPLQ